MEISKQWYTVERLPSEGLAMLALTKETPCREIFTVPVRLARASGGNPDRCSNSSSL